MVFLRLHRACTFEIFHGAMVQSPSARGNRACRGRPAALDVTDDTSGHRLALRVTRKTRSRRLAVAPLHHGAPRCDGCFTPRQTVKASPHRVGAHLSVHRTLWVALGALVASAPGD